MGRDALLAGSAVLAGLLLLGLPWWPGWPAAAVVPPTFRTGDPMPTPVVAALQALDAACAAGDVSRFSAGVTPRFAAELAQRLQPFERAVDPALLRELAAVTGFGRWARGERFVGRAGDEQVVLLVARDPGAQAIVLQRQGGRLLLDRALHLPAVDVADQQAASALAQRLLRRDQAAWSEAVGASAAAEFTAAALRHSTR